MGFPANKVGNKVGVLLFDASIRKTQFYFVTFHDDAPTYKESAKLMRSKEISKSPRM